MAFAIVGFLFVVSYAVTSDQKWPWSTNRAGTVTKITINTIANANSNVNTGVNSNVNSTPEVLPAGVKRFTSDTLGISFTYLETAKDYRATVKEIGGKVYIAVNLRSGESVTTGQWVQVMPKDAGDTLTQAIQKKFLQGYDSKKCYVEVFNRDFGSYYTGSPDTVSLATIAYPIDDPSNPLLTTHSCPADYTKTNGIGYFWMDSTHPDKLLYFSIGQYAIYGNNDQQTDWAHTVSIVATDPTVGWKTYTNMVYGYSMKYPNAYTVTEKNANNSTSNPEAITVYQGQDKGVYVNSVKVYSLTNTNTISDQFGGEGEGWYRWAINGFQNDESATARYSTNKRQESYGGKTFTVVEYDPGSSWGRAPFYYYVSGQTVFIIVDARGNQDGDVRTMLSTFTLTK